MSDVAKLSGVRRQALYDHVGGRDDLVRAVLAGKARALQERTEAVIAAATGFPAKLIEGLLFIIEDCLAEPCMQGLVGEGELGAAPLEGLTQPPELRRPRSPSNERAAALDRGANASTRQSRRCNESP